MDLDALNISLGPNTCPSSVECFQGPGAHIYFSKLSIRTNIPNQRQNIPSASHVWLFEVSLLALNG